ncbi:unnamed protein product [Rotaria socialis]
MRFGAQAEGSITHTEIVQLGFIRSLAQYFLYTQNESKIKPDDVRQENTLDELFRIVHLNWKSEQVKLNTFPLKLAIDTIQVQNALVDLETATKDLPTAHFDAESFVASNRRVMDLRKKVIEIVKSSKPDFDSALKKIGELLHTLQDFYSHSNWVEMGKTDVNARIGLEENIGRIAEPNQPTCSSNGCQKIKSSCNILESLFVKTCPLIYYDCKDNILPEILTQGILTSGYYANQYNEKKEPVLKPTNVAKCSHGSIIDTTAHQTPIGGINKDSTKPEYSPHYYFHLNAVKLAIEATQQFFNDLRKDIGNPIFERLFSINPTKTQLDKAAKAIAENEKFRFFSSTFSIGLSTVDAEFQQFLKGVLQKILSIFIGIRGSDTPTYDISDLVNKQPKASKGLRSALIGNAKMTKKKRLGQRRFRWIL